MDSNDSSEVVTQCPLCQAPMGSRDELQLHYLTSCSGYDKGSNEQPRSKLSSHQHHHQRRSPVEPLSTAGGEDGDLRMGQQSAVPASSTSTATEASYSPSTQSECSVQFMWQPTTNITYPSVTLLASFQRGSVELNIDHEGGHYASKFVNISKGSYEGQLVIGDSFIHPIKEFTVARDDDIIVLQFEFSKECFSSEYGGSVMGYDMQTNPSYNTAITATSSPGLTHHHGITYSNPMFGNYYGSTGSSYQPSADERRVEGGLADVSTSGGSSLVVVPTHYQSSNIRKTNKSSYLLQPSSESTALSPASGETSSSIPSSSHKLLETHNYHEEPMAAQELHQTAPGGAARMRPQQVEELIRQLEEVTLERDALRDNQDRVRAMFEIRAKRLEQQMSGEAATSDQMKEMEELRDRNTALQEQIREYSQTILEDRKLMQSISESTSKEAKQLLDFTKRQQMVHAESFAEMKVKVEEAMKKQDDYIKVCQANISLTAELQDYKKQTRILVDEMRQKDEEIGELKHSVAEGTSDRMALELRTMREKCEGWKEEVDRLMPLEDEVRKLRKENEELARQVTLMVVEGEQQQGAAGARDSRGTAVDYDTMMIRMTELQDTRVKMEEELCQLREERAAILQENAELREGSQPQNYTNLKQNYEEILAVLHKTELAVNEEKQQNHELQSVNLELHQKLVTATDPEKLKSIQERMVRYKNERDTAKAELEGMQARLITAEVEIKAVQDALMTNSAKEDDLQLRLKLKEEELENVSLSALRFREERHKYKELAKILKKNLLQYQEALNPQVTPKLEGVEEDIEMEAEMSTSPSHDQQNHYSSPTLDYAPEQYATESSHSHGEDHITPYDRAASPASKTQPQAGVEVYSRAKPKADSCMYRTVSVRTKNNQLVEMDIQKPSTQLNPKQRPRVVVRRESGYETGTLMYVGNLDGRDMAGVALDLRNAPKSHHSNLMDGTYKDGKRYFKCTSGYGLFLPVGKVYIETESATV